MVVENGVNNIQAAAYNGARTVFFLVFQVNGTYRFSPTFPRKVLVNG